ncbi:MAG: cytochrome ubiquinol oxidase subunit I [Chloroflexi bacterium]|nr:cytochrome ubiquinol oxidase subunit I [Chloroflexota bacterium]
MEALDFARLQFAVTSIYHFFFVPLSIGLALLVAIIETAYVRTGETVYKQMAKFWGKLLLINFAMGVVTGIVMEFQFGMNWSEYSRFVGDIFGAPLAVEALMAFFLESVFLGVWIFGWDKLPKAVHAGAMWMVALGATVSAYWILVANSFMQQPVGYKIGETGRAEMTDFFALITNPNVFVQLPHVIAASITTAAFFVLGISAFHILRKSQNSPLFLKSFQMAMVYAFIGVGLVILQGHDQAQHMVEVQPMKMAAAEALWDSEDPAVMSLFTIGDTKEREDVFAIRVPAVLSILAYNTTDAEVQGINDLQEQYEQEYGPGDYVPPVFITYWTFRIMVGAGFLMLFLVLIGLYLMFEGKIETRKRYLQALVLAIALPYIANAAGWILTEVGRIPWIVFGLQTVEEAVSPNVDTAMVLVSLIVFTLVYGVLMVADVYLLNKYAGQVPTEDEGDEPEGARQPTPPVDGALQGAYSGD